MLMNTRDITTIRLEGLGITDTVGTTVEAIVAHLGAMQAQDYLGALWALGLRLPGTTVSDIEQALAGGSIIRTWPMRGTLHFVPAKDAKWMLDLLTPRILRRVASRERSLELDEATFAKGFAVLSKMLSDGKPHLRSDLIIALEHAGIRTHDQRGYHILWRAAQTGLICLGPMDGKQPTYVLFDSWVPQSTDLSGDEAIAELAKRYFLSHGPATEKDFAGWTGLSLTEARRGIQALGSAFVRQTVGNIEYILSHSVSATNKASLALLPGFDEYMLGYKDRSAALHADHANKIVPGGNGMFLATIVVDGQIVGTWKRIVRSKTVTITPVLFPGHTIPTSHTQLLTAAAERYGSFIGREALLEL